MPDDTNSKYRMYEHSVLDVCATLNSCAKGTMDMMDEHRRPLIQWLRWRVANWTPAHKYTLPIELGVDAAVLALATAVLKQVDEADAK